MIVLQILEDLPTLIHPEQRLLARCEPITGAFFGGLPPPKKGVVSGPPNSADGPRYHHTYIRYMLRMTRTYVISTAAGGDLLLREVMALDGRRSMVGRS